MTARAPEPSQADISPHYAEPDDWQPGDFDVRMRALRLYADAQPSNAWGRPDGALDVCVDAEPFMPEARAQLVAEHAAGIDTQHRVCHAIRGACECERDGREIDHPHCIAMRRAAKAVRQ